jgi:histidyl-tRNA synthetase
MSSADSITQELTKQTALFNELRLQNVEPSVLDEAKKKLGELKKSLALLKGAGGSKDAGKKRERLLLKTAKVCASVCTIVQISYSSRISGYT